MYPNSEPGFKQLLSQARRDHGKNLNGIIICMEHTGLYSLPISVFLTQKEVSFSMVPGLEIRMSLGMTRGKNDKIEIITAEDMDVLAVIPPREESLEPEIPTDEELAEAEEGVEEVEGEEPVVTDETTEAEVEGKEGASGK